MSRAPPPLALGPCALDGHRALGSMSGTVALRAQYVYFRVSDTRDMSRTKKKKSPRRTFRESLLIAWHRLRGGELTPARAAFSVAIGILIGCTPLFGLHLVLVAVLCLPLRLDVPISYISTHVSNPLIAPFIIFADIKLGAVLLGRPVPHLHDVHFGNIHEKLSLYFVEALAGSGVVGAALGIIGGALAWFAVSRRAVPPEHLLAAIERTSARYGAPSSGEAQIALGRLKGDPALDCIHNLGRDLGALFDGGCGRGELGIGLQELGSVTTVTGIDVRATHVATAQLAQSATASFSVADLVDTKMVGETVLFSDVLRCVKPEVQDSLLQRAADSLKPGGRLLLRELDARFTFRTRLTAWLARIGGRFDGFKPLYFRTTDEWVEAVKRAGFDCHVEPLPARLLHGNVLLICTKRAS